MDNPIDHKPTYRHVRQFLINELGLSREMIREEARNIIKETIEKEVARWANEDHIEHLIARETSRVLKTTPYGSDIVRENIAIAAREKALQFFDNLYNTDNLQTKGNKV